MTLINFSIFTILWTYVFLNAYSIGEMTHHSGNLFGTIEWPPYHNYFIYSLILCFIWTICFLQAVNQFQIASMVVSWYFERKSNNNIGYCSAFLWAHFYHLGSLAFGSLIVAFLWILQLILQYLD